MTDAGRQLARAWALFGGSLVGWMAFLLLLSLVPPRGVELPIALHAFAALALLLMLIFSLVETVIWTIQFLKKR